MRIDFLSGAEFSYQSNGIVLDYIVILFPYTNARVLTHLYHIDQLKLTSIIKCLLASTSLNDFYSCQYSLLSFSNK